MTLFLNFVAIVGALVLGWLFYLFLFERGTSYRTSTPVHELDDMDRLRLLTAVLGTPTQSIHSLQVLTEGPQLYEAQISAIRAARSSVCLLYTSPSPRDRTRSRMPSSA